MWESLPLWLPGGLVMAGLVIVSGFFSSSETALFFLSREDLDRLRGGTFRQRLVIDLLDRPDRLLTSILFWNLVVNLTFFTVGILTARRLIEAGYDIVAGVVNVGGVVGIIIFGEVIPKSVAVVAGRPLAGWVSVPLAAATRLLDPVLPTLGRVAAAIRRVRYPKITPESLLETKDLDAAAKLTTGDGELTESEARVFRNVLDLLDLTAEDLMWPRPKFHSLGRSVIDGDERTLLLAGDVVVDLRPNDDVDRVMPIHRLSADRAMLSGDDFQPLTYVPWTAPAAAALLPLEQMQCVAVGVVNEYGDVLGVVTADDALEPIVNPQASRARRLLEREPIVKLSDDRYRVEGMTLLRVLAERLGLPEDEVKSDAGDSRTVAGLIHDRLGRFAEWGDEVVWMDRLMTVVKANHVGEIVVEVEPNEGHDGDAQDETESTSPTRDTP